MRAISSVRSRFLIWALPLIEIEIVLGGMGRHVEDVPPDNMVIVLKVSLITGLVSADRCCANKTLLEYHRLSNHVGSFPHVRQTLLPPILL